MVTTTVFSRLLVLLTFALAVEQCVGAIEPDAKMKGIHRLPKRGTRNVRRTSMVRRLTIVTNEKRLDIPEKQFAAIKKFQNSITADPQGITDSWGPPLDDDQIDELEDGGDGSNGGDEVEYVDDGSGDYADDGSGDYVDDGSGGVPDDGSGGYPDDGSGGGGGGGYGIACDPGSHCVQVSDPAMFTDLSSSMYCSEDGLTCEFGYGAVVDVVCPLDGSEAVIYFDDETLGESYIEGITPGAIAGAFAGDGFTTQESIYPDDSVMLDCYYDAVGFGGGGGGGGYDTGAGGGGYDTGAAGMAGDPSMGGGGYDTGAAGMAGDPSMTSGGYSPAASGAAADPSMAGASGMAGGY